jgi:hypothetical protein
VCDEEAWGRQQWRTTVKPTAEDWSQYYAVAERRRYEMGGDPFTNYKRRKQAQQKALFIGSSLFLVGLFLALYTVLSI